MNRFVKFCDQGMVFAVCALAFFIPISIAGVEISSVLALVFYFLKRSGMCWQNHQDGMVPDGLLPNIIYYIKMFAPIKSVLNKSVSLVLFVSFISIFYSAYPQTSLEGFIGKTLQGAFIFFNFVECMRTPKRLRLFLIVFFSSFLLVIVNGLFQFFSGEDFLRHYLIDDESRIRSSLRQPNDFGAYLLIGIFTLFNSIVLGSKKLFQVPKSWNIFGHPLSKISMVLILILALGCLGLTLSRGAWLAFGVVGVGAFICLKKIRVPLLVIVILFGLVFYPQLSKKRSLMGSWAHIVASNNRIVYWKVPIQLIKKNPAFGYGINAYSMVSKDFLEKNKKEGFAWGGYPHNCYLQMTTEIGFVGLSVFLWMIFSMFRQSIVYLKSQTENNGLKVILTGFLFGVFAFLFHAFFDTTLYSSQLGNMMWMLYGLIVAIPRIDHMMPRSER